MQWDAVMITEFGFEFLDEEIPYFCRKTIPEHKTFNLVDLIIRVNSVALEQILEARKK